MTNNIFIRSINLLLKRQTSILSAAFIIMSTVILSQFLGLIRQRLLAAIFGVSNTLGIYDYASLLPDTIFQLTIAAALASAFIPVFSEYLHKEQDKEGHKVASTLLAMGFCIFFVLSLIIAIFAPFFLQIFNLGDQFSPDQMQLMSNLMRIFIFGQLLFVVGSFFSALLQAYNHFFIPGIAAALYNLGIIIGIVTLSSTIGIYSAPVGVILGGFIFVLAQLPLARKVGFRFHPEVAYIKSYGVQKILHLMWPRTISIIVFQLGTLAIASLIAFIPDPGRMNVIYNFAKTLAFAPVALFGQTIAQAAFPVLSRQKDKIDSFKLTFMTSFNQMLYLILPISALILVLRIPIVRLIFGADKVDWEATVLIGRTLAYFSISIFAQALVTLISRAFYALHNTIIPLIVGAISTIFMVSLAFTFVVIYKMDIQSIAIAYTIGSITQLIILLFMLDRKVGGFNKSYQFITLTKFFFATIATALALYIPIKLLDQLVFDTTRTINLIMLTGISSFAGLSLYLFLTWVFNVREAMTFILLFRKVGNWRELLDRSDEPLEGTKQSP